MAERGERSADAPFAAHRDAEQGPQNQKRPEVRGESGERARDADDMNPDQADQAADGDGAGPCNSVGGWIRGGHRWL
mgnify:CR=1 FL=1